MALTRKFLSALGIEGDKVDEIINAHSETVEALKEERDTFKKEAESYKADAGKLPDLQKELESLKEAAGNGGNAWQVKYDAMKEENDKLKAEYDSYKNEVKAKETKAAKEKAYRDLLKNTGVSERSIDAVLKVTDYDKIELDDEGKIKDTEGQKKAIQKEWAGFITSESTKGADTPTPPQNTGGVEPRKSRAQELVAKYRNEHYGNELSKEE